MRANLTHTIERLHRRRRLRRIVAVACWTASAIVAVGLLLIGLDWLCGHLDPSVRFALPAFFGASAFWILRRTIAEVRERAESPLQVAYKLEAQHPELRDVLANAWEFDRESSHETAGESDNLRSAVMLRGAEAVEQIEWERMLPQQPLRRGLLALTGCFLLVGLIGWWAPSNTAAGLARLVNPLSEAEWTRRHDLEFVDSPEFVAAGDDLTLRLRDKSGQLPELITVHYRISRQGQWQSNELQIAAAGELCEFVIPRIQGLTEYRAIGGDHTTMLWQSVRVVTPPKLVDVAVTVHSPEYTGLSSRPWNPGTDIYVGSRLQLRAKFDQSVVGAFLSDSAGHKMVARLSPDGATARLDESHWLVEQSDRYHLHLTTSEGLTVRLPQEFAIEAILDQPPTVELVEPRDDLNVLSTAVIPIRVAARDELGVCQIALTYRHPYRTPANEQMLRLWERQDAKRDGAPSQLVYAEEDFDLSRLPVDAGAVVEIAAQATDAQPMTGLSNRTLRLKIVSEAQLWESLLKQQSKVVEKIAQLRRDQAALRADVEAALGSSVSENILEASRMHSLRLRQRRISDELGADPASVLSQIESMISAIRRNQLQRPDDEQRLATTRSVVQQLIDQSLAHADESMSEILRQAGQQDKAMPMRPLFEQTLAAQRQVITGLDRMLALLAPRDILGQLERRLTNLESDQHTLSLQCQNEVVRLVSQSMRDEQELSVALEQVVRRQRELGGRFASFSLELSQMVDRLVETEPTLAARLSRTNQRALALETQSKMYVAANQLRRKLIGRAIATQRHLGDDLAELRLLLAGRDLAEQRERIAQLRQLEDQLRALRAQTADLARQLTEVEVGRRSPDRSQLKTASTRLARRSAQLVGRLKGLSMPRAANLTGEASERLRDSKQGSAAINVAQDKLDAAQRAVTDERRRLQVELAQLQMARLEAKLRSFLQRQRAIRREMERLHTLRSAELRSTETDVPECAQLAARQAALAGEVNAQAERLDSLPVFSYLLHRSAKTMQAVQQQLANEDVGSAAQGLAGDATRQLSAILGTLRGERQAMANATENNQDAVGQESDDSAQGQTLQLVLGQLKLLKTLQLELQQQTRAMEQAVELGEQPDHAAPDLVLRQQELIQVAEQLSKEMSPDDPWREE